MGKSSKQQTPRHDFDEKLLTAVQMLKASEFEKARNVLLSLADIQSDLQFKVHFFLGRIAQAQNRLEEAIEYYQTSTSLRSDYPVAFNNLANVFKALSRYSEAKSSYQQALALKPDYAECHYNLADLFCLIFDYQSACVHLDECVRTRPDFGAAWLRLAEVAQRLQLKEKALKAYETYLSMNTTDAKIWFNYGVYCHQGAMLKKAIHAYTEALKHGYRHADVFNNLGVCQQIYGEPKEVVVTTFAEGLKLEPDSPSILSNLGNAYKQYGAVDEALRCYEKVCELSPEAAVNYYNLGFLYHDLREYDKAIAAYQTCLEHDSEYSLALAMMINAQQHVVDWQGLDESLPKLLEVTDKELERGLGTGVSAFGALLLPLGERRQRRVVELTSKSLQSRCVHLPYSHQPVKKSKLKIGYLSADFGERHPVGLLIQDFFSYHDRAQFEIIGLSLRQMDDPIAKKIAANCDEYIVLDSLSHQQAAKAIYDKQIDILIDLAGYTKHARPDILAYQPAPVQCQYMGYIGTMGAEFIDYFISTPVGVPENLRPHFKENVILLPQTPFACPGFELKPKPLKRIHINLPENKFVFCSFNTVQRIEPKVFDCWMRILHAVPNSVLWLQEETTWVKERLIQEAANRGIERARLVFSEREHMTYRWRHQCADLWLDTFCFSGGTTTILCAWVDLPVLTLAGEMPQMRNAATYNHALGMDELNVESIEEYEKKAIELATHADKLKAIKEHLNKTKSDSLLFKPEAFFKQYEQALLQSWQQSVDGTKADIKI